MQRNHESTELTRSLNKAAIQAQRDIERQEAGFKSDGVLTQQERQQLRNELSTLRDDVERMARNGRIRG